jgi:lauroyl/myristoyl acyltransferase
MASSHKRSLWIRFRYRLEWLAVYTMMIGIPILPRWLLVDLANACGRLAFRLDRRSRETARENLRLVFGDTLCEADRGKIAKESFKSFSLAMFDLFWSRNLTAENYQKYAPFEFELSQERFEKVFRGGAMWLTPHYANFEWLSICSGFRFHESVMIVAQDFKNPLLTRIFRKAREQTGNQIVPSDGALLRLMRHLRRGGSAGFLTDLTVKPDQAATIIECFGRKTCVTMIHAVLQQRCHKPIVPVLTIPQPDGTYRLRLFAPLEIPANATASEIAQACWDVFEPVIRETPAPWMWMYKHWRYLPRETNLEYPSYANHSKKFDRLEREHRKAKENSRS